MVAVIWTSIIVFVVVAFLFRKPKPPQEPLQLRCPYCKRPVNLVSISIQCDSCGRTELTQPLSQQPTSRVHPDN